VKRTPRLVSLCGLFCPSDEHRVIGAQDTAIFEEFWLDARNHFLRARTKVQRVREKELAQKKAKLEESLKTLRRFDTLIADALAGRASNEEIGRAVHKLVPDQETKKELFEAFKAAINEKPEDAAKKKQEIVRKDEEIRRMEIDLACRQKLLKANAAINKGVFVLTEALRAGNADAARYLAEAAIYASSMIHLFEPLKPELFRRVAKWNVLWPVLATGDTGWEKVAVRRIAKLGVGDNLVPYRTRFRTARGYDENLPARRWAKAAVRTIEETRLRFLRYAYLLHDFGSPEAFTDFCLKSGWDLRPAPKWVEKACALDDFTRASERQWAAAIRDMVREQLPDFHSGDEWQNQRNAAKASGRDTKGLVQNRILDDICDALRSIAPNASGESYGNSTPEVP